MKHHKIIFFIILSSYYCKGQNQDDHHKIKFMAFASTGRSTFYSNPSASSKFPTFELRFGGGVIKQLTKTIELKSRLTFGVKFKRDAFNSSNLVIVGPPFMELDDVASNRNHYFMEIPLIVQFNIPHPKIGLSVGLNYRFFLPNNESVDFLTNRREIGILPGISYRVSPKFEIGIDYFFGLTEMYNAAGTIDNQEVNIETYNRFSQIRFLYIIGKSKL
jgi:hypothetical protein